MIALAVAFLLSFAGIAALSAIDRRCWAHWPYPARALGRPGHAMVGAILLCAAATLIAHIEVWTAWMALIGFACQLILAAFAYALITGFAPRRRVSLLIGGLGGAGALYAMHLFTPAPPFPPTASALQPMPALAAIASRKDLR